jgi:hypothetical protein
VSDPAPPVPCFDHLAHLTTARGVWEHAEMLTPRVAHGYCTDDNARALIVVSREPAECPLLDELAAVYLRFVLDARRPDGSFRNRRRHDGTWWDEPGSDDSQGRAWWALGVAAARGRSSVGRAEAMAAFATCARMESDHLRPHAFAILGAVEVLDVEPDHGGAWTLLLHAAERLADAAGARIPWFEDRLTYDNARLPEALLAAGSTLGDPKLVRTGLRLLGWLVDVQTRGDRFSFVPHGGWRPGDPGPGFDQQPLEAAAMVDACHRAWTLTGQDLWRARALRAARWFLGDNDTGVVLHDAATGSTGDGLMAEGVNENRGAESTLAGLSALQVATILEHDDPFVTVP